MHIGENTKDLFTNFRKLHAVHSTNGYQIYKSTSPAVEERQLVKLKMCSVQALGHVVDGL